MREALWRAALCVCALSSAASAGAIDVLRFEQSNYNVPAGQSSFTATIVYDLGSGIVGDNFFDLRVALDPPGTGTISITGATRSAPWLYDPALAGDGVINDVIDEFDLVDPSLLKFNQAALSPAADMSLSFGTYAYADVTFALSGPPGSVFRLSFPLYGLSTDVAPRALAALEATITIIVPEPSAVALALCGALMMLRRRR